MATSPEYAGLAQFALQLPDILDAEVKDGRGQRRICAAFAKNLDEVLRADPAPPEAITGIETASATAR
jgi:hypothetical protein